MKEPITGISIVNAIKARQEKVKEGQRELIRRNAYSLAQNILGIILLINESGNLHIDLKDHEGVGNLYGHIYDTDQKHYYEIEHKVGTLVSLNHAAGNAHIYVTEAGVESLRIVVTFRFDRKAFSPALLPELLEVMTSESFLLSHVFMDENDVHISTRVWIRDKPDDVWSIKGEVRDNSLIFTLE